LAATHTILDSLENVLAAGQLGVAYELTDSVVDLGALTVAGVAAAEAAAQVIVAGASNTPPLTLDATHTILDSLENVLAAAPLSVAYALTSTTVDLGALALADVATADDAAQAIIDGASNKVADSLTLAATYTISDTIGNANGQDFSTGHIGLTGVTLTGSIGDQTVIGSAGADTIAGGAGADTLSGGNGADTFVFTTATDSVVGSFDRITDFVSGTDKIQTGVVGGGNSLNQGEFYTEVGSSSLIDDITNAVFNGNIQGGHVANANDIYVVSITGPGAGTYVYQDTNGDQTVGADELVIQLAGVSITLAAGDFIA
ncbi:calcium-binding protein, partial [Pseudomonas umsongensis]|uniref:calcium-binding protein n=1 Tax=Pseudomonas umsongensis TaxID=198618 RepID=UPI00200A1A79